MQAEKLNQISLLMPADARIAVPAAYSGREIVVADPHAEAESRMPRAERGGLTMAQRRLMREQNRIGTRESGGDEVYGYLNPDTISRRLIANKRAVPTMDNSIPDVPAPYATPSADTVGYLLQKQELGEQMPSQSVVIPASEAQPIRGLYSVDQ